MIYLIGGPPKCGKTTLAKEFYKIKGIPWVSTDTLQCVIRPYMNAENFSKDFPVSYRRGKNNDETYSKYSTHEIVKSYKRQAKTVYPAIDMFIVCEVASKHDFILEGYHIEPELVKDLNKKYPNKLKSIFLTKKNEDKFIKDIQKSTTPNDWIIERTVDKNTYKKIAEMIREYGEFFEEESKKYDLKFLNMDFNFELKVKKAIEYFTEK